MKITVLPKLILAFAAIVFASAILPGMPSVAQVQSKTSPPVTGQNLRVAHFPGGRFELTGPESWGEYDNNGVRRYNFREVRRDADTVYLREDVLSVDLELNANRRVIMASWPGMARHQLHRMDRVEAAPRTGGPLIVAPPPVPPAPPVLPPAPPPVAAAVTPDKLTKVVYKGGRFEEAGAGTGVWTQFSNWGGASSLNEIGYDEDRVYLYDQGGNVLVIIDVNKKLIRESRNGGMVSNQYTVADMQAASSKPSPPSNRPSYTLSDEQRAQCRASGGTIERAGLLGAERCTLSYADGGKTCTDSAQCEGKCVAELAGANQQNTSGTCQRNDNPFGCYAFVENGRTGPALCAD